MRPILAACRRARSLEGGGALASLMIVIALEFQIVLFLLMEDPLWAGPIGYGCHFILLSVLGPALFLWTAGFLLGYVSAHTGAGLRIACLGMASALLGQILVPWIGIESEGRSVYDETPSIGGYVWLLRNIGLAAYGYGIVFVALSCWSERRLRRTAPAWVLPS